MDLPKGLTLDRVIEAVEENEGVGFCLDCGTEASGIEPDAEEVLCEECGACRVTGAEQIVLLSDA